ncbi:hypothetical protein OAL98_01010 [Gammaproteobacteria bacterium]|jgi:hypothetical protein|nr:hypothetical protein [Gammaproteobacteria bacterium]|tara:strand:+ start:725 stop:1177 length:453 start_codon:yes stop_codon:yes gene_type:complete
MRLPFKANDETTEEYISVIKELCIIQHEDTWYKDKSHAVLFPDLEDAKKKVAKPHYWILNSIDEYDAAEDKQPALLAMAQIVFNTNNYSEKLVSENENIEAKTELAQSLINFEIEIPVIAEHMISMDVPKYARLMMDAATAETHISEWLK